MKIAISICGHMRSYHKTYSSLKNHILDVFDCDVFIRTYERRGLTGGMDANRFHGSPVLVSAFGENINVDDIVSAYNPKSVEIISNETEIKFVNYFNDTYKHLVRRTSEEFGIHLDYVFPASAIMFSNIAHGIKQVEDYSSENNIKYDFIIRLRPDITIKSFNINTFINNLDKFICTVGDGHYRNKNGELCIFPGILDWAYGGSDQIMYKFYKSLLSKIEQMKHDTEFKYVNSEEFLYDVCVKNEIPMLRSVYNDPDRFLDGNITR